MFLELCCIQSLHGVSLPDHRGLSEHSNYGAEIHGRMAGGTGYRSSPEEATAELNAEGQLITGTENELAMMWGEK